MGSLGALVGRSFWRSNFGSCLDRFWHRKGCPKGGFGGAKMGSKTIPERVKIEDNFQELKKGSSRRSWSRLGPILARSWSAPELENRAPARAGAVFSKFICLTNIWLQDAFWAELRPIWAPKCPQMGGQEGPKRHQKRDQNDIKILIDF